MRVQQSAGAAVGRFKASACTTTLLLSYQRSPAPIFLPAQFQGPEDEEDLDDDERVEVLEDRGWMRGGRALTEGGGGGGGEEEQNLGPLDRARLQEA